MLVRVYRTEAYSPSVLRATLVAEVEVDKWPDDPALFADQCGGDLIQPESLAPEEETP